MKLAHFWPRKHTICCGQKLASRVVDPSKKSPTSPITQRFSPYRFEIPVFQHHRVVHFVGSGWGAVYFYPFSHTRTLSLPTFSLSHTHFLSRTQSLSHSYTPTHCRSLLSHSLYHTHTFTPYFNSLTLTHAPFLPLSFSPLSLSTFALFLTHTVSLRTCPLSHKLTLSLSHIHPLPLSLTQGHTPPLGWSYAPRYCPTVSP